jgi:hypothetical protein
MPLYGDLPYVYKMLRPVPEWEMDEDSIYRVTLIQKAVSLALEEECGMTWGATAADTTEIVWIEQGDRTIVLPHPARAITSIRYGGTITGTTMTGGTTETSATLYYPVVNEDGYIYAIASNTGYSWLGDMNSDVVTGGLIPVSVTGDFITTDVDATVPDDITYIASYLIAETWKKENASPAGFLGPEGIVPIRDPWADPLVKRTIARHTRPMVLRVLAV